MGRENRLCSPLAPTPSKDALVSDSELLELLTTLTSPPSPPSSSSAVSLEDARAEWQRVRVRLKAQRAYHRKRARLQRLRHEVEELQRQLKQLEGEQQGQDQSRPRSSDLDASTGPTPTTREEIQARLRAAWELGARLRQENNALRRQFMAMAGFTATIGELLSEEYKPYISVASQLLFLRPLTPPECRAIRERSMAVVRSLSPAAMLSAPAVSRVAGWRERRQLTRGLFRYAMQKRFTRCGSAATLATKSFLLLTEPAQLASFYSDALGVDERLVQKVDADTYVVFQQMRLTDMDAGAAAKSLLLVSRVQSGGVHSIYLYGLQQDELPVSDRHPCGAAGAGGPPEFWNNQFCWLQFEDEKAEAEGGEDAGGGPAVRLTYAGVTPTASPFWLVEVMLHCLRWERAVLGPWVRLAP